MATRYEYPTHADETHWSLPALGEAVFTWDYDARSDDLLKLYGRAKGAQWDADIGLWSPRVQAAYAELGGIEYASADAAVMLEKDERIARSFDERMQSGFPDPDADR